MRRKLYATLAVLCVTVLILCSCGGSVPSGTYRAEGNVPTGFTFSGNKVTMTAFGFDITDADYEIVDGELVITYNLFGLEGKWRGSFSQGGDSITINGIVFKKQ